jgi:hypothetical protein
MLFYGSPVTRVTASTAKVSLWLEPLLHLVDQIMSAEQDSQPRASLISRQAVPYWTHGGTYCPGVSTPKTQSLVDSRMKNHITWQNPTVSTIPTHAQTMTSILTTVTSHHDGWKTESLSNNTSQTQHHKDEKTCMTLMTTWLSITNQVWTQILSISLR